MGSLVISRPSLLYLRKAGGTKGKLHSHDTLKYHRDSAARVQAFMSTFQNPETSIQRYVLEQSKKAIRNKFQDSFICSESCYILWKTKYCLAGPLR